MWFHLDEISRTGKFTETKKIQYWHGLELRGFLFLRDREWVIQIWETDNDKDSTALEMQVMLLNSTFKMVMMEIFVLLILYHNLEK